ncbi:MAG: phosphatidate cytidylyltransferase [Planctomycetota bacterium]
MRWRILIGSLLCLVVAGVFLVDREVLERPLVTRTVILLLALGVAREVVDLAARKVETGPGLYLTAAVALVAVFAPHLLVGTRVPGVLLAVAAALAGGIRLLAMAPLRTAARALPESVVVSGAVLYAGGLLWFLDLVAVTRGLGLNAVASVVAVSKGCDIFAYFGGTLLGRKRIVPALSPGKTWEGTILGLLAAAGLAVVLARPLSGGHDMDPALAAVIGLLLGGATFLGDLAASGIKRWAGAKDSSSLLREFGGILDLVDGILFAGPVAVLCLMGT